MTQTDTDSALPKPVLSPTKAVALGFAAMQVGPCLAAVPILLQQFAGPGSWISALITLAVALMVARAITTFASRFVVEGSLMSYAKIAFGPSGEYIVAVSLMLGYLGVIAGLVNDEVYYLTSIITTLGYPFAASFAGQSVLSLSSAVFTAFFAYRGPSLSAKVSGVLAAISLPTVVGIVAIAFFKHHDGVYSQFAIANYNYKGIAEGAIWGIAIYVGFDGLTSVASETENPKKYVPTILTAILVFFGLTLALGSIFQYPLLAPNMDKIIAGRTAISVFTDQAGLQRFATIVDFILCSASFASAIALFNFAARIVATSANDGMLPRILGLVDEATHAPRPAIIAVGLIGGLIPIILRLGGSVTPIEAITTLGSILVYFWILPYGIICLGAIVILRRPEHAGNMSECIMPALGIFSLGAVLIQGAKGDWKMPAIAILILMAMVTLMKVYARRSGPRAASLAER
jgi:amino acid transporter